MKARFAGGKLPAPDNSPRSHSQTNYILSSAGNQSMANCYFAKPTACNIVTSLSLCY
jgi:hypothetical protein